MSLQPYLSTTHHTISWFQKCFQEGELELKPPFQRNAVWTERQKSFLIDTILHSYPVPELYMQEYANEDGSEQHIVVDGQQRIRACLEFIDGKFELSETENDRWRDLRFDDLSSDEKKKIFGYQFVIRLLPEMPEPQLRAMFARLNRNTVALNAQELRHATYWGPFITLMEDIADQDYWAELDIFTPNDVRRMLDVEFISELAVGVLHGVQNKKKSLDRWYAAYEQEFDEASEVREIFHSVTRELTKILPDFPKTRWRRKSDFYSLFLVFSERHERLPLARGERETCGEALRSFGNDVTEVLRDWRKVEKKNKGVSNYALGVEKAASDLHNRTRRRRVLDSLLGPLLGDDEDLGEEDAPSEEGVSG